MDFVEREEIDELGVNILTNVSSPNISDVRLGRRKINTFLKGLVARVNTDVREIICRIVENLLASVAISGEFVCCLKMLASVSRERGNKECRRLTIYSSWNVHNE